MSYYRKLFVVYDEGFLSMNSFKYITMPGRRFSSFLNFDLSWNKLNRFESSEKSFQCWVRPLEWIMNYWKCVALPLERVDLLISTGSQSMQNFEKRDSWQRCQVKEKMCQFFSSLWNEGQSEGKGEDSWSWYTPCPNWCPASISALPSWSMRSAYQATSISHIPRFGDILQRFFSPQCCFLQ